MAKSVALNQTQTLDTVLTCFRSSDTLQIYKAIPNSNGTNLTAGSRTFTAAVGSGSIKTGGSAAIWTATASDTRVVGDITVTNYGDYLVAPTDLTTNAATVDSGSSNATWTLLAGTLKTIFTAGTEGSVVKSINCINTDSAKTVALILTDASASFCSIIGTIAVTGVAGYPATTVAPFDLLSGSYLPFLPYDGAGKRCLPMKAGYLLKLAVPALTAAKWLGVQVMGEHY